MLKKAAWLFLLLVVSFGLFLPVENGVDYVLTYRLITQSWLEGRTNLYDLASTGLYNPPWLVWLVAPFVDWPVEYSLALLRAVTLVIIVYGLIQVTSIYSGYARLWAIVAGLINLHNFDLLFRGQIDAFALLGTLLAIAKRHWFLTGLGYVLMTIKPPNFLPIILFLLWLEFR